MKLSEIKDEQALDTLADILEPTAEILADEKVREVFRSDSKIKLVQYVIKHHKRSVIEIMARLDGKEPENYTFSLVSLPVKLMGIVNDILQDRDMLELFTSQA